MPNIYLGSAPVGWHPSPPPLPLGSTRINNPKSISLYEQKHALN